MRQIWDVRPLVRFRNHRKYLIRKGMNRHYRPVEIVPGRRRPISTAGHRFRELSGRGAELRNSLFIPAYVETVEFNSKGEF